MLGPDSRCRQLVTDLLDWTDTAILREPFVDVGHAFPGVEREPPAAAAHRLVRTGQPQQQPADVSAGRPRPARRAPTAAAGAHGRPRSPAGWPDRRRRPRPWPALRPMPDRRGSARTPAR